MVAPQRRDVREKEVRDEHRLRRPEVRERRHQRVAGRAACSASASTTRRPPAAAAESAAAGKPQIERHLLVARSAGVQPAAGIAEPLDEQPLDEAVDVLVGAVDERRVGAARVEDRVSAASICVAPRRRRARRPSRARAPTRGCPSRRLRTGGDRSGTRRRTRTPRRRARVEASGPERSHRVVQSRIISATAADARQRLSARAVCLRAHDRFDRRPLKSLRRTTPVTRSCTAADESASSASAAARTSVRVRSMSDVLAAHGSRANATSTSARPSCSSRAPHGGRRPRAPRRSAMSDAARRVDAADAVRAGDGGEAADRARASGIATPLIAVGSAALERDLDVRRLVGRRLRQRASPAVVHGPAPHRQQPQRFDRQRDVAVDVRTRAVLRAASSSSRVAGATMVQSPGSSARTPSWPARVVPVAPAPCATAVACSIAAISTSFCAMSGRPSAARSASVSLTARRP